MEKFVQKDDRTLRFARLEDAAILREIYAPYIEMPVSFEYEVPSLEEFRKRIEDRIYTYPYLVLCENDVPFAYAYASRYKERAAYQWDVELSVYVKQNVRRAGAGSILYRALLELLEMQGVRNAFAIIGYPNEGSKMLHRRFNFRPVGIQYRAGYKCGAWHDVLIYQREFDNFTHDPQPIVPISEFSWEEIEPVLKRAFEAIK